MTQKPMSTKLSPAVEPMRLNTAQRHTVRIALATGATVAALIGAQTLAILDRTDNVQAAVSPDQSNNQSDTGSATDFALAAVLPISASDTPTALPSATPLPSVTPRPSATTVPSIVPSVNSSVRQVTALPTLTLSPTVTPSNTPRPSATIKATATVKPKATVKPAVVQPRPTARSSR